jgi:hypothetical protein
MHSTYRCETDCVGRCACSPLCVPLIVCFQVAGAGERKPFVMSYMATNVAPAAEMTRLQTARTAVVSCQPLLYTHIPVAAGGLLNPAYARRQTTRTVSLHSTFSECI